MKATPILLTTIIILTCSVVGIYSLTGHPILPQNLVSLGQINGKYFFYDKTNGTWEQSRKLCSDAGLTLAEISTVDELNFLKTKYSESQFDWVFWTAGRDARSQDQFVWDGSKRSVSAQLPFYYFHGIQTCVLLLLIPTSPYHGQFYSYPCTLTYQTLCQTP